MKKLLVLLLMLTAATSAFSQFRIRIASDLCGEALATTRFGGEYNRYDKDSVLYQGPGSFNIFSMAPFAPHNVGMTKENERRL